jgi:hypothetical protein
MLFSVVFIDYSTYTCHVGTWGAVNNLKEQTMNNVTHIQAFRAQEVFPLEAKLNVIGHTWREGTPGYRFYQEVLAQNPATVGECIGKAGSLAEPFSEKAVQGHLRWLYTSAGGLLEVDGVKFATPIVAEKPKPVAQTKKSKAKKAKKAEAQAAA